MSTHPTCESAKEMTTRLILMGWEQDYNGWLSMSFHKANWNAQVFRDTGNIRFTCYPESWSE